MAKPDALFKYLSVDAAQIILRDNNLRWVSPELLDDPWSIGYEVDLGFDHETVSKSMLKTAVSMIFTRDIPDGNKDHPLYKAICRWRAEDRFKDETEAWDALSELLAPTPETLQRKLEDIVLAWRDLVSNTRLVSFSETPKDLQSWLNKADNYRGLVLRFDPIDALSDPQPMSYVTQRQQLTTVREQVNDLVGIEKAASIDNFPTKLLSKSKHLSHEKEWRCINILKEEDLDCGEDVEDWYLDETFSRDTLKAAYFGFNMREADKNAIAAIMSKKYPKAVLYNTRQVDEQFDIEFEKFSLEPQTEEDTQVRAAKQQIAS